jgi:ATP-dependent helicase/nuclease subunit A
LQAPIVILADANGKPEYYKANRDVLWQSDSTKGFIWGPGQAQQHGVFETAKQDFTRAELGEYYRLLYVAATRAEEHLIVTGWETKQNRHPDYLSWYEGLQNAAISMRGTYTTREETLFDQKNVILTYKDMPVSTIGEDRKQKDYKPIPSELRAIVPDEIRKTRPLRPSQPVDQEPAAISPRTEKQQNSYKRGQIIHKILATLPDHAKDQQQTVLDKMLARETLETKERDAIVCEVMTIINDPRFAELFSPLARAEIPVVGEVVINGKEHAVSGQIDRLLVTKDRVVILDYKTNRPPALNEKDVPEVYRNQLRAYKLLLEKIYPGRTVETALLWTSVPYVLPVAV